MCVYLGANPTYFSSEEGLRIDQPEQTLAVTDMIVGIGGTPPTGLLRSAGVQTMMHYGRPI